MCFHDVEVQTNAAEGDLYDNEHTLLRLDSNV
jgi:hypothetical protein